MYARRKRERSGSRAIRGCVHPRRMADGLMKPGPYSFPMQERLKRARDFDLIFSAGRAVADRWLVVHGRPNGLAYNRLGFAVGKKHGGAVARNRLKRVLREAYRIQKPDLPQGYDLVVVPRKGCPDDVEVLTESMASLLKQVSAKLAAPRAQPGEKPE